MKIIKKSVSVLSVWLLLGCSNMGFVAQSTNGQNSTNLDPYPLPTSSYTQLSAPLNSRNAIKRVKIDGSCFRAMQKAIDVYNHYRWENYQTYKDIVEDLNAPLILNEDIPVVNLTCSYYDHDKILVSIPTPFPQILHVVFDKDLTILSWAFGEINRP